MKLISDWKTKGVKYLTGSMEQSDHLFDEFLDDCLSRPSAYTKKAKLGITKMTCDVEETESDYVLHLDLPGLDRSDLTLVISKMVRVH
jgi:HSP20 family molecular chaperone IbpA